MSEFTRSASRTMSEWYGDGWSWLNQLDHQQWLILLVVSTAIGFICLRGLGSRERY